MSSVERKLSVWGGFCAFGSGLFFVVPVLNAIFAIAVIAGLTLVIGRLGFFRGWLVAAPGIVAAAVVSSLTMGFQTGIAVMMIFILAMVLPAFMMGWGVRRIAAPGKTVGLGLIPLSMVFILSMVWYGQLMTDLPLVIDQLNSELGVLLEQFPALSRVIEKSFPPAEGAVQRFLDTNSDLLLIILRIVPGVLALGLIGLAMSGLMIAGSIAVRMKIIFPRFRPFHMWTASGWWLLATVLGLLPVVLSRNEVWIFAGANLLIVTGHVYLIVGLSIMESFFLRMYNPKPFRAVYYGALIFLGIFAVLNEVILYAGLMAVVFLVALGLADSRFNFAREILETNND
jgi:hypothetical protein